MRYEISTKRLRGFFTLQKMIKNGRWPKCSFVNSVYINNKTKLEVICKAHGSFWMAPSNLKAGQGCPKCGLKRRIKMRTKTDKKYQKELIDNI